MTRRIIINGKFLRAPPTGVHRVAGELAHAIAALVQDGDPAVDGFAFELWHPHDAARAAGEIALPRRQIGPLTGIPWEQAVLPLVPRRGTLLNLCNIGPVLARDALTMIHDVQVRIAPQSYRPAFRWWYRATQPLLARRNRGLLTVSHYSRGEIARVGLCREGRVAVIHNGVDHVLRFAPRTQVLDRLRLRGQRFVVALANTQPHKNLKVLLEAFAGEALDGVKLVLFGSATRADFRAAGLDPGGAVVFAGRVDDGELRALVEAAVCLAFPSTTEGFGLPPLEAMLLGCPAVVAPCGALPEVCGEAALYAAPDDPAAWATAIRALADDHDLRSRYSEAGRRRAGLFTWRAAACALMDVLRRTID